jgi:hypothetical protein
MVDLSNLYGGYLKAGRYSGIKQADLTKALKPYGLTLASLRTGKINDATLRRRAVDAVLKRRGHKPKINKPGPSLGKAPTTRKPATVTPMPKLKISY